MRVIVMATVNQPCLCIGSYIFSPQTRTQEFHKRSLTLQNILSSCSAFMTQSFERIGFSLKGGSSSRSYGHGFPLKVKHCRALLSEDGRMLAASSVHHAPCMDAHAFLNVFKPCAGAGGHSQQAIPGVPINRRAATTLLLLTFSVPMNPAMAADEEVKLPLNLETYTDEKEGFMILRPAQWNKIDKAGATVLFEDPQSKGNNVGVVVNPVRISSLAEFGTVDVVADKLLQAEKRKPSTNDVQLIKVNERQVRGGAPLYQLEYKLDSSRGVKRILSAVTVASRKLYILNVAYADSLDKPLQPDTALVLEKIANSFDILS